MRIAIPYYQELINPHFGHTEFFKFYDIEDGTPSRAFVARAIGSGHEVMQQYLSACGVNVVICGNIGAEAMKAMEQIGVQVYAGVRGICDNAMLSYLAGTLSYNNTPHDEDGCGCGGSCGDGCGDGCGSGCGGCH